MNNNNNSKKTYINQKYTVLFCNKCYNIFVVQSLQSPSI